MKRSATGAVMTGIAVGLKEALQPQKKEVPFVIEARGEPDDPDKPIDLHFDPDSPADTVAIIRRPATEPLRRPSPTPDRRSGVDHSGVGAPGATGRPHRRPAMRTATLQAAPSATSTTPTP